MNERIQELADKTWRITSKSASDEFCEKFAELIVQECAEIFEGVCVYTDQQRPERIDTIIKEHFGVE